MNKLTLTDEKEIDGFMKCMLELHKDDLHKEKAASVIDKRRIVSPFAMKYMTGSSIENFTSYNGKIFLNSEYLAAMIAESKNEADKIADDTKRSDYMADEAQRAYLSLLNKAKLYYENHPTIKRGPFGREEDTGIFDITGKEKIKTRAWPKP
jgi:hypothetical protein